MKQLTETIQKLEADVKTFQSKHDKWMEAVFHTEEEFETLQKETLKQKELLKKEILALNKEIGAFPDPENLLSEEKTKLRTKLVNTTSIIYKLDRTLNLFWQKLNDSAQFQKDFLSLRQEKIDFLLKYGKPESIEPKPSSHKECSTLQKVLTQEQEKLETKIVKLKLIKFESEGELNDIFYMITLSLHAELDRHASEIDDCASRLKSFLSGIARNELELMQEKFSSLQNDAKLFYERCEKSIFTQKEIKEIKETKTKLISEIETIYNELTTHLIENPTFFGKEKTLFQTTLYKEKEKIEKSGKKFKDYTLFANTSTQQTSTTGNLYTNTKH